MNTNKLEILHQWRVRTDIFFILHIWELPISPKSRYKTDRIRNGFHFPNDRESFENHLHFGGKTMNGIYKLDTSVYIIGAV